MKNIIIVNKQGNALAMGGEIQGQIIKQSPGTFLAIVSAIKETLLTIPVEMTTEPTTIWLPDTVQALQSGRVIEYIRTGKTASGNLLTAEELVAFKEVWTLYGQRVMNVSWSLAKYIRKDDATLMALKTQAWNALDANGLVNNNIGTIAPVTLDPDKELRAIFDTQIAQALSTGNMEMYKMLKAERDNLQAPIITTAVNNNIQAEIKPADFGISPDNQAGIPLCDVVFPENTLGHPGNIPGTDNENETAVNFDNQSAPGSDWDEAEQESM